MPYTLHCDGCNVEPEPGKDYETMDDATEAFHWHCHQGGWLLNNAGDFLCPECAAEY